MYLLESYDQFSQRKKNIDNQINIQKKKAKQKLTGLKRQRHQLKIEEIKKKMNTYVAGASGY